MKVLRRLPHAHDAQRRAVAIGNFDGVHRGHRVLLEQLKQAAAQQNLMTCVMTFDPHPRDFFLQQQTSATSKEWTARISPLRDKLAALHSCGIDETLVLPFNWRWSQMEANQFIEHVLIEHLHSRVLVVGEDFRFGQRRQGDIHLLREQAPRWGYQLLPIAPVQHEGQRISSSRLRQALQEGDLASSQALLGRPYSLQGRVRYGQQLGRELGFPTLNQRLVLNPADVPMAAQGIFVSRVFGLSEHAPDQGCPAVSSLGRRPTLGDGLDQWLETYVLNWPSHLDLRGGYGKHIRVELLHKLHDERRYSGLEELKHGIANDVLAAHAWHKKHANASFSASIAGSK